MTLKEVVRLNIKEIIVYSYGYQEKGVFGIYQPFSKAKKIKFTVEKLDDNMFYLKNSTFMFEDEDNEDFIIKDGICTCFDPDLIA